MALIPLLSEFSMMHLRSSNLEGAILDWSSSTFATNFDLLLGQDAAISTTIAITSGYFTIALF